MSGSRAVRFDSAVPNCVPPLLTAAALSLLYYAVPNREVTLRDALIGVAAVLANARSRLVLGGRVCIVVNDRRDLYRPSLREWVEIGEQRALPAERYVAIQSGLGGVNVVRVGDALKNVPRGGSVWVFALMDQ